MSKTIKISFTIVVVVAAVFFGYNFLVGDGLNTDELLVRGGDTEAQLQVTQELLALIDRLERLDIDTSIFEDPAFRSLRDFSVRLTPQPIGRENPFAPLPPVAE